MNWHQLIEDDVFKELNSGMKGLGSEDAALRLEKYGLNQLKERKRKTVLSILLSQFRDLMIITLIIAAVISGLIGDAADTIVILVIVLLNAGIGFFQEFRADKAMQALKKMSVTMAKVVRDGHILVLPSPRLVPGDLVILETGGEIPADLRIVESVNLKIDESALTGESVPVEKTTSPMEQTESAIADRRNMGYKGTYVTYGRGKGVVTATGMNTELGNIAAMLQEKETMTPLQARLVSFSKKLSAIILLLCLVFFVTGWIRGEEIINMILTSISLAVAAIPEALPAVITISLALAARKLVQANTLVRKLHAVETLGSVTYICTDKTGTLTKNRMMVEEIYVNGTEFHRDIITNNLDNDDIALLLQFFMLNNDAEIQDSGQIRGDPTEAALMQLAAEHHPGGNHCVRLAEIPFDGKRKMMTTFHPWKDKIISITKGAPEILVSRCSNSHPDTILAELDKIAEKGQRVLGFAYRLWDHLPTVINSISIETNMIFAGMAGMIDPPREEIREAVRECRSAGIIPVVITGDHPLTARSIAERTGIISGGSDLMITGRQLNALGEEDYRAMAEKIKVYARVSPEQKLRIVKTLQDKNQFVAMAGDGINDAPSIKKANIGISMGITGTDVTKEAADLILLDDNFSTIVSAVKEGRRVYDNILKFIKYLMTTNSGEIWTLLIAPLIGLPIPLLPVHILWVNLVSDGLPAVSLSFEKADKKIMQRPPRPPEQNVFAEGRGLHMVWVGILMAGVVLGIQSWSLIHGLHWQTMAFTTLSLTQLMHLLAIRSEKETVFSRDFFSNRFLLVSFTLSFILQLAVVYVPALNPVFKTNPLTLEEISICIGGSMIILLGVELEKIIKRIKTGKS